jgi:hypothetical protein
VSRFPAHPNPTTTLKELVMQKTPASIAVAFAVLAAIVATSTLRLSVFYPGATP